MVLMNFWPLEKITLGIKPKLLITQPQIPKNN